MRKFLLAALLALGASSAWAQNIQCPTRPVGDNTNACASTAFVQNTLAAGLPLANGDIFVGNASNIAVAVIPSGELSMTNAGVFTLSRTYSPIMTGNWIHSPTSGVGITINAPANTNTAALNINQSGPASGSVAGPISLNLLTVSSYGGTTNAGTNFGDFGVWTSAITAFRINFTAGPNSGGALNTGEPFMGFLSHLRLTTAGTPPIGADYEAATGLAYINVSAPNANLEGLVGAVVAANGSVATSISGVFAEVDTLTGSSITQRAGVRISSLSDITATGVIDAAIVVGSGSTAGGFKAYTYFNAFAGPVQPIQTTGDFAVSGAAMTWGSIFNASNWTVTNNIMNFPNWVVTGAGASTLAVSQTVPQIYGATTAAGTLNINATSNVSPSGDKITLTVGAQVTTLQNATGAIAGFQINQNTSATPSIPGTSGGLNLIALNATQTGLNVYTYAQAAVQILGRADGTAASPTKLLSGDVIGGLGTKGYDNSGAWSALTGLLRFVTAEDWNGTTNHGTTAEVRLVPAASGTLTLTTTFFASGGFAIGSTVTDPGQGGLYVSGATITLNGLATDATHTDRTVCQDTTSKSLFFGSGAIGVCLGTSSERFKHDIVPLAAGLEQIERLRAIAYKLNADHGDPDKLLYGFTAEQGSTVLPDLVGLDTSGRPQTFDYMGVVPVLVRAVQQLKADNDNLREKVRAIGGMK